MHINNTYIERKGHYYFYNFNILNHDDREKNTRHYAYRVLFCMILFVLIVKQCSLADGTKNRMTTRVDYVLFKI